MAVVMLLLQYGSNFGYNQWNLLCSLHEMTREQAHRTSNMQICNRHTK
jgi:hypothetical protein